MGASQGRLGLVVRKDCFVPRNDGGEESNDGWVPRNDGEVPRNDGGYLIMTGGLDTYFLSLNKSCTSASLNTL